MKVRLATLAALLLSPLPVQAQDGHQTYTARCSACHLPNKEGVPNAFPPLTQGPRQLAATADGRRYLILVVVRGLNGPITVDGSSFRGIMPAQPLDDEAVANVLNHLVGDATSDCKQARFTAAEVAAVRQDSAAITSAQVASLRPE